MKALGDISLGADPGVPVTSVAITFRLSLGRIPWRRLLEWAALAGAFALLLLRFVHLELAPFINDEVEFLEAARQQLVTGKWASISPLKGNLGPSYGPAAIWFYGAVQLVTGSAAVLTCLTAMCALVTAAHTALAVALGRVFAPGRRWFLALMLAFVASSPYLHFWSRLAWDQITNAVSFAVIALLCADRLGWRRCLLIGVLLGLGVSSHPMIGAFTCLTIAVIALEHRHNRRLLCAAIAALVSGLAVVNVPYVVEVLSRGLPAVKAFHPDANPERLLQVFRVSTTWQIQYFFDQEWKGFVAREWLGIDLLSKLCLLVVMALFVTGLATSMRREPSPRRRVVLAAAAAWVVHPLFLAVLGLGLHPHYQFPSAWIVPVAVAGALAWQPRRSWMAWSTRAAVLFLTAVQAVFIVRWMGFVAERHGTRGDHYWVPLGQQVEAVEALCDRPGRQLQLENAVGAMLTKALAYHSRVLPGCQDKEVVVCEPRGCPLLTNEWQRLRLQRSETSPGQLALTTIESP